MPLFRDIIGQIGLADLLDIALVSAVFFAALSLLRMTLPQTATRRILVALPVVVALGFLARVLDLYLMEEVIQVVFIVILIAAVVVFQSDIRRALTRAVMVGFNKGEADEYDTTPIDRITEAVAKMAETHMGALIAIRGRDPLDDHIQGGVELNGVVTQPLLYSIFHRETPGHDGAVVIEGRRILRFAVHLPLSADFPEVSRYGGTRHAAALGLAEVCDALVIAVSEELGTIRVAESRALSGPLSASQLKQRLWKFWQRHYLRDVTEPRPWWKSRNLQTGVVSVTLALLIWLLVIYSPYTVVRTVRVPIELRNLPNQWAVGGSIPEEAEVVLRGPEQVFRRLEPENLAVLIDMSKPSEGLNEVVVTEVNLRLPPGIELARVSPQVFPLELSRVERVRKPVIVRTSGELSDSLVLARVDVSPDSVTLLVMVDGRPAPDAVYTSIVDLSAVRRDTVITGALVPPDGTRLPPGSNGEATIEIDVRSVVLSTRQPPG